MAGPRNRVTVTVDQHFRQWGDSAMRGIVERLDAVMPVAAEAAKTAEVRRHSDALADSIHPLPAEHDGDKVVAGIGASDFKANWYEQGTLARRSKRIKHARTKSSAAARESNRKQLKASGSQSGVKPLHFLRKGLYATRTLVFHEIGEAMQRARAGL